MFDNEEFKQWRNNGQGQLLWIRGDPGKGKTMLLCGIIDELGASTKFRNSKDNALLAYFFCQATDSRINNACAVLRGLLFMLIDQQPTLISIVRKRYDQAGKQLFADVNAWTALTEILKSMLKHPSVQSTYLIIDALDECETDLGLLLRLIESLSTYSNIKWIVSSRNWPSIERGLNKTTQKTRLCLELNEKSVSAAVTAYIQLKVDWLAERNEYDSDTRNAIQNYLSLNAKGTFLWVALACQGLSDVSGWKAQERLMAFPPGLDALYRRMMDQICSSEDAELCTRILAVVSVAHRPLTLDELTSFVDLPRGAMSGHYKILAEIIGLCGSFLTLRERTIFFVHQSAKDFLLKEAHTDIFLTGIEFVHYTIFSRSLQAMSKTLHRDVYNLASLGCAIEEVEQPDPDPLAATRYACVYWIDHLCDIIGTKYVDRDLKDGGEIDRFLRQKYLYWLEALSLLKSIPKGVVSMAKLEDLLQVRWKYLHLKTVY